ncbi:MAG: FtsX-like permease family protein, partial [Planctomycetota bacterium]
RLGPEAAGLAVQDVARLARAASGQALDFGGLFLGLSLFLIAAAVLLTALLFVFGVEQRSTQAGTLGALGWPAGKVRRVLLAEGAVLAAVGAALGAPLGLAYTRTMLAALATVWRGAVAGAAIRFHASPATVLAAAAATLLIAVAAMWVVLRRQSRTALTVLLAGEIRPGRLRRRRRWAPLAILLVCAAAAVAILARFGTGRGPTTAVAFFGAGSLLLVAMLAGDRLWLNLTARAAGRARLSRRILALRNVTRRPGRSLAVMALLAAGSFLVVAIGAFWLDPTVDAHKRSSGTGGFALIGTSAMGVFGDLNRPAGLAELGVPDESIGELHGVRVVSMRVRRGDDASCLNLNRAQQPQLLGVRPDELAGRKAFRFVRAAEGLSVENGWSLLDAPGDAVPAVGDEATVVWALGRSVGETVDYVDQRGRAFKVRIVATIANSILQGNLLISEKAFLERFPGHSGYRMFLIDAAAGRAGQVRRILGEAGTDVGLELTGAVDRLGEFNQVQNTYLSIFQALGGLGLILGSVGLGVVVMRNVLERRGELALMQAVGYSRSALRGLVLWEHWALLVVGLANGVVAAIVAVWPALRSAAADVPYALLAAVLAGVVISGLAWTLLATAAATRGPLLPALRSE